MSERLTEIESALAVADSDRSRPAVSRSDLRDLLAVAKAAGPVLREWLPHSGMCVAQKYGPDRELLSPRCRCAPEAQALRAALAKLGGATCPECNDTGMIRLGTDERGDNLACLRCDLEGGAS